MKSMIMMPQCRVAWDAIQRTAEVRSNAGRWIVNSAGDIIEVMIFLKTGVTDKSAEIDFTPFRLAAQKTSERLTLAGYQPNLQGAINWLSKLLDIG
jgi:hypothetical protein